jgi:5'-3' exonuclease
VAIDEDWRPAFRVEALPTYKTHRVSDEPDPVSPQEEKGRHVLTALGVSVAGSAGYEAEDVIATLAARSKERVEVLSGDRDLFALVSDPEVKVLYPKRGVSELEEIDEAAIERRYGIPGRAYGDYALLRGDPSDGLPGVRGIGAKTASRLLSDHGSLEGVLAAASRGDLSQTIARRLAEASEYLDAARRVVLPITDIPLDHVSGVIPREPPDPDALDGLVRGSGLEGAVTRFWAAARS